MQSNKININTLIDDAKFTPFHWGVLFWCLMIIIFAYARQIWVRIDQVEGRVRIGIAGRSIKNTVGLKREVRHLLAQLKDNLENPK